MSDFRWGIDMYYKPPTFQYLGFERKDAVHVYDTEKQLENMGEYKEAKAVINEILASLGKGTG